MYDPFYDPKKSFVENLEKGPFSIFSSQSVFKREIRPRKEIFGHKVYTNFGIPAGPLPNAKFIKAAFDKGFDINIYKTVRTNYKKSHDWPNILPLDIVGDLAIEQAKKGVRIKDDFTEPISITNSFGVGSYNPDIWQPDMQKAIESAGKGQIMIGSFQGTDWGNGEKPYVNDHILAAKLIKETGVKVVEMNLSCPNEGKQTLLCFDVEKSREIVSKVKEELGNIPLILKMGYFADSNKLRKFIKEVAIFADGLAAINTLPALILDKKGNQALPGQGREISGVCGASIKWAGISMVKRLSKFRKTYKMKYKIIGVGGVMTPTDYEDYVGAGADFVMSATGAMWNPYLGQEIWNEYFV